jgi:hypothetical protein
VGLLIFEVVKTALQNKGVIFFSNRSFDFEFALDLKR